MWNTHGETPLGKSWTNGGFSRSFSMFPGGQSLTKTCRLPARWGLLKQTQIWICYIICWNFVKGPTGPSFWYAGRERPLECLWHIYPATWGCNNYPLVNWQFAHGTNTCFNEYIYLYIYIYIHNQQTKCSFSLAMLNHRKVSELKMGWTYQSGLAAAHQNGWFPLISHIN